MPDRHLLQSTGEGMVRQRGVGWSTAGVRGDLATASREVGSEVELAFGFALGVGRRRGVPLIGESAGVEGLRERSSPGGASCAAGRGRRGDGAVGPAVVWKG